MLSIFYLGILLSKKTYVLYNNTFYNESFNFNHNQDFVKTDFKMKSKYL